MAQSRLEKIGTIFSRRHHTKLVFTDLKNPTARYIYIHKGNLLIRTNIADCDTNIVAIAGSDWEMLRVREIINENRVSNLIRTGAMNMNDRPLWYDVYRTFPPAVPPKFERPLPDIKIQKIFYIEDIIRAKFQIEIGRRLPALNLKDTQNLTLTQKMIQLCTKIQKEKKLTFEEAYQEAFSVIKAEGFSKEQPADKHNPDLVSTFKAALENKSHSEQPIKINVKDILKDK